MRGAVYHLMGVGGVDPDILPFNPWQLADADPGISLSSLADLDASSVVDLDLSTPNSKSVASRIPRRQALTLVPTTGSTSSGERGARVAAYLAANTMNAAEAMSEGTPTTINIEACGHFVAIIMLPMKGLMIAPIRPIPCVQPVPVTRMAVG